MGGNNATGHNGPLSIKAINLDLSERLIEWLMPGVEKKIFKEMIHFPYMTNIDMQISKSGKSSSSSLLYTQSDLVPWVDTKIQTK